MIAPTPAASMVWHRAAPSLISPWTISRAPSVTLARLRGRCNPRQICPELQVMSRLQARFLETAAYRTYTLPNPESPPPPRNANVPQPSFAAGKTEPGRSAPQPPTGNEPPAASSTTGANTSAPRRRLLRPRKAAMTLSATAVSRLRQMLDSPTPRLIRVGVKNRGCSGLAYHLEYVDRPGAFDETVEQDGVRVLIDSKALFSIIGSEMDWVSDKLEERFVFKNPNITEQCGCGESFSIS